MKKIYTSIVFIFIAGLSFGQWSVYTCNDLPEAVGWKYQHNVPGPQNSESIVTVDTFTVLDFYSPNTYDPAGVRNDARRNFRMEFDSTKQVTVVVRVKGYSQEDYLFDSISTIFEAGLRPGKPSGFRDIFSVNYVDGEDGYTTAVNLMRVDSTYHIGDDKWHTFRIAMDGEAGEFAIYLDEDPTPVISGITTDKTHDDNEIRFGDEGKQTVGGYIDWIAWNSTGMYAPGEGDALPENVFVDGRDDLVSVNDKNSNPYIIYPNPARTFVNIATDQPGSEVILSDITGKRLLYMIMNTTQETLNTSFLPSGLYFVTVKNGNGNQTNKLILE